ncbi:glycosyltransferase family 4 protein [Kineosporia sp. NBRC 101677]|uniref:glycosyltransferase family 4 protein n=1 Tax=Kineosporia sp. NBRC 101677 TaxID=3032197 RepID=UPI002552DED8|nr:glycosyltransferase family 4 protein [Kineosporia sp. NBRC 101677]
MLSSWPSAFGVVERRSHHYRVQEALRRTEGEFPQTAPFKDALRETLDVEFRLAAKVVVYSSAVAESHCRYGVEPEKIQVIPISFEPGQLERTEQSVLARSNRNARKALFVGRATLEKGIDIAAEAVRRSRNFDKLLVVGSATAQVQAWMAKCSWIEYLGVLPGDEVRQWMESVNIFIMPSVESFGLAVLEAIAMEQIVLVSHQTGVGSYLKEANEAIVGSLQPDDWAARLDKLASISDEERRVRIGRQRQVFSRLSPTIVKQGYQAMYEELLA